MRAIHCVLPALSLVLFAAAVGAAEPPARIARTAEEIPFIVGQLWIPQLANTDQNNRGVLRSQTRPGQTHIEGNFSWRFLEPQRDQWDFSSLKRCHALAKAKGLKIVAFPWMQYVPPWFKKTADYVQLTELGTGKKVDLLSPWAPGTLRAVEHFYAGLKKHAGDMIDIISVGGPTSDYGEIGLLIGAPTFLPGKSRIAPHFPQDPDAWHQGLWCGDRYALPHFGAWAVLRYGSLAKLNAAWKTDFARAEQIAFPEKTTRQKHRRWWIDFIYWYEASQVDLAEKIVAIVRKHFPRIMLETKLGFGDDNPRPALDRTAVCRRLAKFAPFTIRSTHAGGPNRGPHYRSYWFYKRMAPVCHRYGAGFGTEPPGGDLTLPELRQQMFEDAAAGTNYVFSYFQNYKLLPDTVAQFKRLLRPEEKPLVDIGILYPTAQLLLDMSGFPPGQIPFCSAGREFFDYDVIDENMIDWGMLDAYRVLIHTGGTILEAATLARIDKWVRSGGVFITRDVTLESVEGDTAIARAWASGSAAGSGKGSVRRISAPSIEAYLKEVVAALHALPGSKALRGFDGKADGTWTTDFPSRQLRYDVKTRRTTIVPRALPRIGVREGRFIETASGKPFAPRGFNYIRLQPGQRWHGTFAPDAYDADRAERMLADLTRRGFNVVRVFIDHEAGCGVVASKTAQKLSPTYMANVFDFLARARRHRVYVIPSLVWLPRGERYQALRATKTANVEGVNQLYLNQGHIDAKALYCADFARAIRRHDPTLASTVFAYEPCNEASFISTDPPFSLTAGTCTPANGKRYDLTDERQLQQMADENVIRWADACRAAIRTVDPDAMVSVNVFTFRAVKRTGPGHLLRDRPLDRRFPARPLALARSTIDYMDIHLYPHGADTLAKDLASIEFDAVRRACQTSGKPLIMGEFGAFKHSYKTLEQAAAAMTGHLRSAYAQGFAGFLYWTYDTDEQPRLWNARSGDGQILEAFVSIRLPRPVTRKGTQ